MSPTPDPFSARDTLEAGGRSHVIYRLDAVRRDLARTPYTIKVLLEAVLRNCGRGFVTDEDVRGLAGWRPNSGSTAEVPFLPARVVMQDFTGVPCVVDLAAMRDAMSALGGEPGLINPLVPADLVIDHSVQVDRFGTDGAFAFNVEREYERNRERYMLLRWAQQAFRDFRAVPPGTGIVHQVNLEYLSPVVQTREVDGELQAFPDTLVGTDSHTTMINGVGVLGFGVGGIEAEAVLLGQPLSQPTPTVIGFKLSGRMGPGTTATDLVLTVTELLRTHGVVGKFVEFFGAGLSGLSLADRATISNMSPEFGATATMFPIDDETLRYMEVTGRPAETIALTEAYAKAQGLFRTDADPDPEYDEVLELDLSTIVPSLAGPRRPQDRVTLDNVADEFRTHFAEGLESNGAGPHYRPVEVQVDGDRFPLQTGSVAIAAITSCTNTSNPSVMVGAGLLAKKAVEKGLETPPWVKTSLAPGSRAVTGYLDRAGLTEYLDRLRFDLVGYGCTTCIGNSGPLAEPIEQAIEENGLVAAAVLSGNRNFEGRIHPNIRASYLASPPLVVAYALAGRVDIDLTSEPLGEGADGPVYLRDIWPSQDEIAEAIGGSVDRDLFTESYRTVFEGDERWRALPVPEGQTYAWDPESTYVQLPPFFTDITPEPPGVTDIVGARALAVLGDSITTDHISPAGSIPASSPAGRYLVEHGVEPRDFNSFGSRRGNHEVMMRGTFGNIRLRNALAGGKEGNWTEHLPTGEITSIYEASMKYQEAGTPLVVLAGGLYGNGSSRDWAAKGTLLLGVRAVVAKSFERIHRGNLVGMGVIPLQFREGEGHEELGLTGRETFSITGLADLQPRQEVTVEFTREDGTTGSFQALARIDGPTELNYIRNGGILPTVLRRLYAEHTASAS
ncbi:aconitate hydratase AcnA [Miltoncostaea marina]|uniref:aconitate hydratase AcnA n=1 Tax=Miltoncostaea marina TaxID=2843215 RepID=UPI001C3C3568|nr:aconitate hydratase AcnA [Miltoncostaea marina]